MRMTCSLALSNWEVACQAEPAPSEMKPSCKLHSCSGLDPKMFYQMYDKCHQQIKDALMHMIHSVDSMLLHLECAAIPMLCRQYSLDQQC